MAASTVLKRSLSDKTDLNTCCIICLKPKNLTSKPTGRQAIIAAAETRSDDVYKRLQSSSLDDTSGITWIINATRATPEKMHWKRLR